MDTLTKKCNPTHRSWSQKDGTIDKLENKHKGHIQTNKLPQLSDSIQTELLDKHVACIAKCMIVLH